MSSKRKWDQPGPAEGSGSAPPPPADDGGKSANDAALAAAAIAAKIAAQFAGGGASNGTGVSLGAKDPHDAEFTHDIDINDVRNRYVLTKGSTQSQIHEETGASISTKGVWYPDRSRATEKDPPLYLHISATTKEIMQKAVDKVNELLSVDLGSLVEDKSKPRERKRWPEEKLPVGLESLRNFNVRAKVVGPSGMFVKYIQQETLTRVQIKGIGSGFIDQETGRESDEPMHIHITGPEEGQVARAKVLTEDLLEVVRAEHAKMAVALQAQQMELHQAQQQYAMYSAMQGYTPQPPSSAPPPPPPGEQPPPPPGGSAPTDQPAQTPSQNDPAAFQAYWAAYGYDVNSQQFKDWMATQFGQQPAQPEPPTGAPPPAPPAGDAPPPPPPS